MPAHGECVSSRAVVAGGGERRCSDGGKGRGGPALSAAHWVVFLSVANLCQKDPDGRILSRYGRRDVWMLGNGW